MKPPQQEVRAETQTPTLPDAPTDSLPGFYSLSAGGAPPAWSQRAVLWVHGPFRDWDPNCPRWAYSRMARSPLAPSRTLLGEASPAACLGLGVRGAALAAVELCPQQCSCVKELVPSQHAVLDLTNLPTKLNRGGRS